MARLIAVLFAIALAARAQQPSPADANDQPVTLRMSTHLVLVDVTVTDKSGHPVLGLPKDSFSVLEDGHPQTVKFFEEHAPVDPVLAARQQAERAQASPPNTFTNHEPFTGNPVTVLLLNELTTLAGYDIEPLRLRMLGVIHDAPPGTPFSIYQLDSSLKLIQPVTQNRELLAREVNRMWAAPRFGTSPQALGLAKAVDPHEDRDAVMVQARRKVFTQAMQQLSASFGPEMGRKTIFTFTGGLRCNLSSGASCASDGDELKIYLCGVMDTLEQARISMYRYYPAGEVMYGFGCNDSQVSLRDIFDTNAHYYTLYYTPTNSNWDGKYRRVKVAGAARGLRLSYREGYFGRAENAQARSANPAPATWAEPSTTAILASDAPDTPAAPTPARELTNPLPIVFTVEVEPGTAAEASPAAPGKEAAGTRDYTLHFLIPSAGLRLVRGQTTAYTAKLQLSASSYVDGQPVDAKTVQVSAAFASASDPRIGKGTIKASLTVRVPERGPRVLHLAVRDVFGGQLGQLDIPVEKIVPPQK